MPSELLNRLAADLPAIEESHVDSVKSVNPILLATQLKRWKFALSLPLVDIKTLPDYGLTCVQCQEPYNKKFEVAGKNFGHESPAVLPCGCVIGFHCARQWLSPFEFGCTYCPFCDLEFLDMAEESETDLQTCADSSSSSISDDEDYIITLMKEIEEEEEMTNQLAQLAVSIDPPRREIRHFPSIEEVLEAGHLPTEADYLANQRTPNITLTTPEGTNSHVPTTEILEDSVIDPCQAISQLDKPISKRWSAALAAVKAVDLLSKRSGA